MVLKEEGGDGGWLGRVAGVVVERSETEPPGVSPKTSTPRPGLWGRFAPPQAPAAVGSLLGIGPGSLTRG